MNSEITPAVQWHTPKGARYRVRSRPVGRRNPHQRVFDVVRSDGHVVRADLLFLADAERVAATLERITGK
ncbi:MAG: hypothetical protein E6Q97_22180 [Desulfurellales bacterium]|nr:MAG: hypothetical protein E6Q97_22180 [Desulfurellales bacterium]